MSTIYWVLPQDDFDAFRFINPEQVIHTVHVISGFHFRYTMALLLPSMACWKSNNDKDWDWCYVNM